jgi:propionate CoA-transferase
MRAAAELRRRDVVNLGVGMPSELPSLLSEAGLLGEVTITTEHGGINGIVNPLPIFGAHTNADALLDPPNVFDMYDGGILNATLLGMAQADLSGNVNVSQFGGRLMGCGGFINITTRTKTILFCGTLTAGGLVAEVEDGRMVIRREGKMRKLVSRVEHQTFNGQQALNRGQRVLLITERGMFELTKGGWLLSEVAPGIDPVRDIAPAIEFELRLSPNLRNYPEWTTSADRAGAAAWLATRLARGDGN